MALWLLAGFDVEYGGDEDVQPNTCRIRPGINIRSTGIWWCQAKVPGQDHQERRQWIGGAFETVMR
jgi:hypothetical protein